MRHFLRFLIVGAGLSAGATAAWGQTPAPNPNNSFEVWEARNPQREVPRGWVTTEDLVEQEEPVELPDLGFVTKSTDARQGSLAVSLNTVLLPGLKDPIFGFVGNGSPTSVGVPYTARPARLQFWYKLTGPGAATDEAYIQAVLTRYQSRKTELIGGIGLVLPPAATYTLVSEPLEYESLSLSPDTVSIDAFSGTADELHAGTSLLLDDIQLTGSITATRNPEAEAALQIYPNPSATGEFSLASLADAAFSTAPFTVTDVTGRVVLRQEKAPLSAARGRLVDLRGQRGGVYLLQLHTPAGVLTRKLVIR
ncbi:hypothetical protein HNQ93_000045 [Hymenobacter luteus]|uniref:T9SS type A sorting domain-containing protein n=2 Tax=Hymenobacter TaxID=89966 RepID=A0A7W9WAD3_9BACT|nr:MULTISPECIES: T9SS type A sorting domain-containing protein [Hymenobacter]MBB4600475.1 hypothetical protein [Hymenobacter latericoloratus]MBB6057215.1 hypothetical protein [Hymenobacter luteus]